MKKFLALALLFTLLFSGFGSVPVRAQSAVTVIEGTVQISANLRYALENYLNINPPSSAIYYAPTSVHDEGTSALVSLAGLNLSSPTETWSMEAHDGDTSPSKVLWAGTLRIFPDGSGQPYSSDPSTASARASIAHLALTMPTNILLSFFSNGGGSYVQFPFDKTAMYGPRGVHGSGDYGTSGMRAVDLVGGASLGSNVMTDHVYASDTGTIDYVCDDGTSVAVRTHNSTTGDYFVYAHLLNNANLEEGHTFSKGGMIGTLKHSTFSDTCGWAEQGADIYHVHWMFTPSSSSFRVAQYTLNISSGKFSDGTSTIATGGWLQNSYVVGSGGDDPTGSTQPPSFWDNIVNAVVATVGYFVGLMPEHTSPTLVIQMMFNAIGLVFRIVYVFIRGNFNLTSMAVILLFAIGFELVVAVIYLVFWVLRVITTILDILPFF